MKTKRGKVVLHGNNAPTKTNISKWLKYQRAPQHHCTDGERKLHCEPRDTAAGISKYQQHWGDVAVGSHPGVPWGSLKVCVMLLRCGQSSQ